MGTRSCILVLAVLALGACASTDPRGDLSGTRTVFHNPYATIDRFEDELRKGAYLPGSGRVAFDREGKPVRLRREERRAMRDRAAAVRSTIILREALEKGRRVPVPFEAPPLPAEQDSAPGIEPAPAAPPIAVPASVVSPPSDERR